MPLSGVTPSPLGLDVWHVPSGWFCLTLRASSSVLLWCHQRVRKNILRSNCRGWTPTMQDGWATKGLMDTSFPPMILAFVVTIVQIHCREQVLSEWICFLKPQLPLPALYQPRYFFQLLAQCQYLSLLSTATPRCVYLLGVKLFKYYVGYSSHQSVSRNYDYSFTEYSKTRGNYGSKRLNNLPEVAQHIENFIQHWKILSQA